jgi:hypothetical protein
MREKRGGGLGEGEEEEEGGEGVRSEERKTSDRNFLFRFNRRGDDQQE